MTCAQAGARYGSTRGYLGREGIAHSRSTRAENHTAVVLRKSSRKVLGVLKSPSQQVFDVSDLLTQQIQLARKTLNVGCSAAVDIKIEFATQAVFGILPVLAHHDDRRLNGCQHGEEQVQENKRIRIPRRFSQHMVRGDVSDDRNSEEDDKSPRATETSYRISDALTELCFLFDNFVGMAIGADAH